MTVFEAMTLMISFGVLILMLSDRKNNPPHMLLQELRRITVNK
ncbi:putative holin-like toxin [Sporolactobacillus terrae]|nr:putative holin-like toxin [Sporolactobacillus terrae]UAK15280.1 putative holin-like toxin [Sporolactobacillus terrae]